MRWRDAAALAARAVARRFGRTALTIVAVALAAALLTALLMIANTAKTRVIGQLTRGGPLATIRVEGGALGEADVRRIERLPDVKAVLPVAVTEEVVVPPDPPLYGEPRAPVRAEPPSGGPFTDGVVGIDVGRPQDFPITIVAGRLPRPGSTTEAAVTQDYLGRLGLDRNRPAAVLGTELQLGAPRFLGADLSSGVWARWTRATIVGVVAQEAGSGDVIVPVEDAVRAQRFEAVGSNPPASLGAEGTTPAVGSGLSFDRSASTYAAFLVEARSLDRVGNALDELDALGYSTSAPESLIASVQRYLHVVVIVLTAIGLIALVVAALGVANALFAAVRERRREIGVLKAIGARDRDVRRIFLLEAGFVGVLGGLLGAVAGWAVAKAVALVVNGYLLSQGLLGVQLIAPLPVLAGTVGGAILLALVAGALPATRAARLPAREAMGEW